MPLVLPRIGQAKRPEFNVLDLAQEPSLGFADKTLAGIEMRHGRPQLRGEEDQQRRAKKRCEMPLAERWGRPLPADFDPHKPHIDAYTFPCARCGATMRRVPEVIDTWFDSGAMPVAQWHYPFEHEDLFRAQFPADYICEAVDQTRGWFYTLLVIAAGLARTLLRRLDFPTLGCPTRTTSDRAHVRVSAHQATSSKKLLPSPLSPVKTTLAVFASTSRPCFATSSLPACST